MPSYQLSQKYIRPVGWSQGEGTQEASYAGNHDRTDRGPASAVRNDLVRNRHGMMAKLHSPSVPLKVALVGAGMISRHHLVAWRKLGARVQLVAVCDPDLARAKDRAAEFGICRSYADAEAMFAAETIDALDIASPRETHATWVETAAARGIDILCQKPLTPTLAEAEALYGRLGGRARLMVHENWRFRPWYRELGRWVASDELGDILHASMSTINSCLLPDESGRSPALERQPFMARETRLMIAESLIHHLDVMRVLCGPMRVTDARVAHTLPEVRGETFATIFLENETGAPVVVYGTMAALGFPPDSGDRLELIGAKAGAVLDNVELRLFGPHARCETYDAERGYQASFDNAIAHFVECLSDGTPFETDVGDNIETLRLVEEAYCAADRHMPRGAGTAGSRS